MLRVHPAFFPSFNFPQGGGGEKWRKIFENNALFCEGTRKLQKIMNTELLSQGIVHDGSLGRRK